MSYKLILEKTTLRSWPHKVHIVPNSTGTFPGERELMQSIHDWLNSNNIKYEYSVGRRWYLRNEEDATAFLLRWS